MTLQLANTPEEFKKARSLIKRQGLPVPKLIHPTIISVEDNEVVALLGTYIENNMIIAGPLTIDPAKKRPVTAFKMLEAYDIIMRDLGITSYVLPVEQGCIVEKVIDRYYSHISPYSVKDGYKFYIRYLDGSWEAPYGQKH